MEAKIKENLDFLKNELNSLRNGVNALKKENLNLKNDLDFYKSVFQSHPNSAIFNLHIKKKNGEIIWIDKNTQYWSLHELDDDPEVKEWLKPVRCER